MKKKIFNGLVISFFLIINITLFMYIYKDNIKDTFDNQDMMFKTDGRLIEEDEINTLEDSKIDGQNLSFDTDLYYYYGLLSKKEQKLYKQVYANVNQLSSTFIPVDEYNLDEVKKIIECVFYDHPEFFWLDNSYGYKYTKDGKVVQLLINFNYTKDNIQYYKKQFDTSVNSIINEAKKYKTNFEKEKFVHDKLIKMTSYNKNEILSQSAYSVLINGQSVCAGYSRAFQYIMNKMNIRTYYITGISKENHAWNIIKLDGEYYNVDLTWDDKNGVSYTYFNKNDKDFSLTHRRTGLSLNLPTCNGIKYYYQEVISNSNSKSNANNNSNNVISKEPIISDDSNITSNKNEEKPLIEESNSNSDSNSDNDSNQEQHEIDSKEFNP